MAKSVSLKSTKLTRKESAWNTGAACRPGAVTLVVCTIVLSMACEANGQRRLRSRFASNSTGIESPYPGYDDWALKPLRLPTPPQAPRLIPPVNFRPNLIVYADPGRMLSQMYRRDQQITPVNDRILETNIQGLSLNNTTTVPILLPSRRGIEIELQLQTAANSRTVGTNRAATAHSLGITKIVGTKKILITPASFQTTRARTLAQTDSEMIGFNWGRRIGGNIARQRADDQASTFEYISASKASQQAGFQFDTTVDHRVRMLQRQFRSQVRNAKSRGQYPDRLRFRSTPNLLIAEAVFENDEFSQSSLLIPPAPQQLSRDQAVIQMHESIVNELMARQLRERDFRVLREEDWAESMSGLLPIDNSALRVADADRKWTLKMAESDPFRLRLSDGKALIAMNVLGFKVGDREYPGMKIEAEYDIHVAVDRITATRTEKLRLTPMESETKADSAGRRRVGIRQQVFRSMVRKRFNPILAESIDASQFLDRMPQSLGGVQIEPLRLEYSGQWFTSLVQFSNR